MPDAINCIAYYRVSTDRQGKSGLGLEAQQAEVERYLNAKGWLLTDEYIEVESGKKTKRPKLEEAIARAKKEKATLVIAKLDRLARNVHFISGLMETGINFVAVDMPNADRFMLHIYAAMAEEEGRRISERTKAALAAAKARGVELGKNGKVLAEKNKTEAEDFAKSMSPIIEQIKADGFRSVRAIMEELNNRGVSGTKGGKWHLRSTNQLLNRILKSDVKVSFPQNNL